VINNENTFYISNFLFSITCSYSQTAKIYIDSGDVKYKNGDFKGSLNDFNNAIKLDSTISEAYKNVESSNLTLNDKIGALQDLDKAIALNPQNAIAYFL